MYHICATRTQRVKVKQARVTYYQLLENFEGEGDCPSSIACLFLNFTLVPMGYRCLSLPFFGCLTSIKYFHLMYGSLQLLFYF